MGNECNLRKKRILIQSKNNLLFTETSSTARFIIKLIIEDALCPKTICIFQFIPEKNCHNLHLRGRLTIGSPLAHMTLSKRYGTTLKS